MVKLCWFVGGIDDDELADLYSAVCRKQRSGDHCFRSASRALNIVFRKWFGEKMSFQLFFKRLKWRAETNVSRQTIPRGRTSNVESTIAEVCVRLAWPRWNKNITTAWRSQCCSPFHSANRLTQVRDVCWCHSVKCLVNHDTEFEQDPLWHSEPMEMSKEWSHTGKFWCFE